MKARLHRQPAPRGRPRRTALTIVEAVISLAITTMLLTAVSAAFAASIAAVENNDQFFRATQTARVSLHQMLTEVRRAHAVDVSGNTLRLITYNEQDRSYVYSPTAREVRLVTNDITTDPDYVMAAGVTSAAFAADTVTDAQGISRVVRVTITLVVRVADNEIRLSGSAAPRRSLTYN
jgi:type II secretory pathway pseudopilin PulG